MTTVWQATGTTAGTPVPRPTARTYAERFGHGESGGALDVEAVARHLRGEVSLGLHLGDSAGRTTVGRCCWVVLRSEASCRSVGVVVGG